MIQTWVTRNSLPYAGKKLKLVVILSEYFEKEGTEPTDRTNSNVTMDNSFTDIKLAENLSELDFKDRSP